MKLLQFLTFLLGVGLSVQTISAFSWWDMTPLEIREKINQKIMSLEAPVSCVGSIENKIIMRHARSTPIRIYRPTTTNMTRTPVILLIHGGAWVAGNLDTHDNLARYLCSETETVVVSVGYTNSPEGKFPLPLQQCYDTLLWIEKHAIELSADISKMAVLGDSAGGNMAAALCLMARDQNGPKIALQILINPAPDLSCEGTIERQNDDLDILRWQANQYLSNQVEANHPYVSPLQAKDLSHLPEAVILLAQYDELYESGQKYAQKLEAAGVPTYIYCQQGIGHLAGHGARACLNARESLDVAILKLKEAFFKNQM